MSEPRLFRFEDDAYSHIDWLVTCDGHRVAFDANADRFGDGEPGDGEFTLTLTVDQLRKIIGGKDE